MGMNMYINQIREELNAKEKESLHRLEGCTWHPEYGSWMVEATPRRPFSGYAADLVRVSTALFCLWLFLHTARTLSAHLKILFQAAAGTHIHI